MQRLLHALGAIRRHVRVRLNNNLHHLHHPRHNVAVKFVMHMSTERPLLYGSAALLMCFVIHASIHTWTSV